MESLVEDRAGVPTAGNPESPALQAANNPLMPATDPFTTAAGSAPTRRERDTQRLFLSVAVFVLFGVLLLAMAAQLYRFFVSPPPVGMSRFASDNALSLVTFPLVLLLGLLAIRLWGLAMYHARTEASLRESEALFRAAADHAPALLWMTDSFGRCTFCNKPWLEFTGRTMEQMAGDGWAQAIHPDDRELCVRDFLAAFESRRRFDGMEVRVRRADGQYRQMVNSGVPRYEQRNGQPVFAGFVGSCVDITQRREAESTLKDRESLLRSFYRSSPLMMGIAEVKGDDILILTANEAAARFRGASSDALSGRLATQAGYSEEEVVTWLVHQRKSLEQRRPVRFEYQYPGPHADARIPRWLSAVVAPLRGPEGRAERFLYFVEDATERKTAEERITDLLDREKTLRRELDHRVRNNLSGLLGLLGLYERSGRSGPEIASAIRGKVLAMKEVHDIVSRARGGAVDFRSLLSLLLAAVLPEDRRESVRADGPHAQIPPTQAGALAMIVHELATNSVKHGALGRCGGDATVRWSIEPEGDERLFRLIWSEQIAPSRRDGAGFDPKGADDGTGVGLRLIEGLARSELRGRSEIRLTDDGITCEIAATLDLTEDSTTRTATSRSREPDRPILKPK